MDQFNRIPDQELLLRARTRPYFDALLPVWGQWGPDVGMSFARCSTRW